MKHDGGKDKHIVDIHSRIHKYSGVSTFKNDFISAIIDSITIRMIHEIMGNHLDLSQHSNIFSPALDHPYLNMLPCVAINFI